MIKTNIKSAASPSEVLDLLFNLYLAGRKMKQLAKHHSAEARDSMLRVGILKLLQKKPSTISEMANLMSTGMSAMSEKVKDLMTSGLVKQIASEDGRQTYCQLSSTGLKQLMADQQKMMHTCMHLPDLGTPSEIKAAQKIINNLLDISV